MGVSAVKSSKVLLVYLCWSMAAFAEEGSTVRICTISRGKSFGYFECEIAASTFGKITGNNVTGFYVADEATLLGVYSELKMYLLSKVEASKLRCGSYRLDDVVFGFYEYHLQCIPCYIDGERKVYINAYRPDYDDGHNMLPATKLIRAFDGGDGFWSIIYDTEKNEFSEIHINPFS